MLKKAPLLMTLFLCSTMVQANDFESQLKKTDELKEFCYTDKKVNEDVFFTKLNELKSSFETTKEYERHIRITESGCIQDVAEKIMLGAN